MSDFAQKIAEIARLNDALAYVLEQVPPHAREKVTNWAQGIVRGDLPRPVSVPEKE